MEYIDYLYEQLIIVRDDIGLTNNIDICDERSFKTPADKKGLLFVIRKLTGTDMFGILTQPVMIYAYSELNTMNDAYLILSTFCKKFSKTSSVIGTDLLKQDYDTPVVLRAITPDSVGFRSSWYVGGSYVLCKNVQDVTELKLDNELHDDFHGFGIGFANVLHTVKKSGEKISKSLVEQSGLVITFTLLNQNNNFCNKIVSCVAGTNTTDIFNIKFKLNGVSFNLDMVVDNINFSTTKTGYPSFDLTFRK